MHERHTTKYFGRKFPRAIKMWEKHLSVCLMECYFQVLLRVVD